jgi:hypothetical protein
MTGSPQFEIRNIHFFLLFPQFESAFLVQACGNYAETLSVKTAPDPAPL